MSVNSVSANVAATPAKKKMSPVKKGALIAGGIAAGLDTISLVAGNKMLKGCDSSLGKTLKNAGISKGKYAAGIAAGIAVWAAIGAGIGAIVKACKGKEDAE